MRLPLFAFAIFAGGVFGAENGAKGDSLCQKNGTSSECANLRNDGSRNGKPSNADNAEKEKGKSIGWPASTSQNDNGTSSELQTRIEPRLDDLRMDNNEDFEEPELRPQSIERREDGLTLSSGLSNENDLSVTKASIVCQQKGKLYAIGEKFESSDCEESCVCLKNGEIACNPLICDKSKCEEYKENVGNSCCRTECSRANSELSANSCLYKNVTYAMGSEFKDGCESVCWCQQRGKVECRPRCAPVRNTTEHCVAVPDQSDACCMVVLCDVEEHDITKPTTMSPDSMEDHNDTSAESAIISATTLNATSVLLKLADKYLGSKCDVEATVDDVEWKSVPCDNSTVVSLTPGKTYKFRLARIKSNVVQVTLPNVDQRKNGCQYKGNHYKFGEDFHDGCESFCICDEKGVECAPIECPTDFGLDVLDPHCIDWETQPSDFVPKAPNCCPEKVHCRNNGSCFYMGETFPNWSEIPAKVSGCENRCYCETGNVTCQRICELVSPKPPPTLPCDPSHAILTRKPGDDCCLSWICPNNALNGNDKNMTSLRKGDKPSLPYPITSTRPDNFTQSPPSTYPPSPSKKNTFQKKDYFPGPFSEQFIAKKNYSSSQPPKTHHKPTQILSELLSPFHLDQYLPEIEKELRANRTEEENATSHNSHFDTGNEDADDFLTQLLGADSKKPPHKQTLWSVKPDEIADLVTNPNEDTHYLYDHQAVANENGEREKVKPHANKNNKKEKISENASKGSSPTLYQQTFPSSINEEGNLDGNNYNKYHPANFYNDAHHPLYESPYAHPAPEELYPIDPHENGILPHLQNIFATRGKPNGGGNVHVEDILTRIKQQNPSKIRISELTGLRKPPVPPNFNGYRDSVNSEQTAYPIILQREGIGANHTNQQVFNEPNIIGHFPNYPSASDNDIKIHLLEAIDDSSVRLVFSVPPILVGLHGRVELRYTSDQKNMEISTWEQQILAPPNDLIATRELEFELGGLKPNTAYKIKIMVNMRDVDNKPTSEILSVTTLPSVQTTLPPVIAIDPQLTAIEVNSTYVKLKWRIFADFELQFIDGVQLRYKQVDDKVYAATPLIHRAITTFTIEDLKPDSSYEIGLVLIPFPSQTTELQARNGVSVRTTTENDPFKFDVILEVVRIKPYSVELSWSGVPYPEDKYVNIYRAIYQSDNSREDFSHFKVSKRDSPQTILITDLKPNTKYHLWLESYLTNGKIKKSNVKEFVTKNGNALSDNGMQSKLEGIPIAEANSYAGPLVGVSILALLFIASTVVLLYLLARKYGTNKAPITQPIARKNNNSCSANAAYDNPSYKASENGNSRNNNNCSKSNVIPLTVFNSNKSQSRIEDGYE